VSEQIPFRLHQSVKCPNCGSQIGYGQKIINQQLTCPSCKKNFHYNDGFTELLATIPAGVLFFLPVRVGLLQTGTVKIKVGELEEVIFGQPFYRISNVFFTTKDLRIYEVTQIDNVLISAPVVEKDRFVILSSRLPGTIGPGELEIKWYAIGSESDEPIPVWHIFVQNSIELIKKQEFGASIVLSVVAFDAFLSEFLTNILMNKFGFSSNLVKRTLLSHKYNRQERLSYWLEELTGKRFSKSPYNEEMKRVADLRNKIVHPELEKFDEKELSKDEAVTALEIVLKSIKWINDLKRQQTL